MSGRRLAGVLGMMALLLLFLSTVLVQRALAAEGVDAQLLPYKKVSGVSGSINSVGSDTMNNLMTLWCEGFSKHYPNVKCQIEGKGSSTAPPALIAATAQLGPMSRAMKSSESDGFEEKFGYKPTQIKSALDSLAIYVHKDNTIAGLTIDQADAIFSKTKKCGATQDIKTWGQLAMTGDWTNRPISIYGRNSASGTYAFFKEHAMCKGDFKDEVKEQPGSASVVQGITEDRYAIGYSGIGYKTSGVRTLPLASKKGEPYKEPSYANVIDGSYPLARFLYIYVNKPPKKPLDPLISEFIKYILSAEGQKVVVKDGYDPLPEKIVRTQLKELE
ncbi:MAG: PstS family phosphate ABC transporter substrate-binding protein [Nitrospirae bacterium]|nr:PstS family phosphate ABC transporter substrate-binding protein [Nitrospirota bacterium]